MKESLLLASIKQYLDLKKYLYIRNNTGSFPIAGTNGSKRYMSTGSKGSPDLLVFSKGHVYGLELKSETGRCSVEQLAWAERFNAEGFSYVVVKSLDDVMNML